MPVNNYAFHQITTQNISVNYQLFLPHDYESKKDNNYPLILFLHGIKKRGEDIGVLDGYGLTWIAESKQDFPFIVVTPQCPSDSNWILEYHSVIALVDEIITNYRVDSDRIYITGFSMGGNGAWDFALRSPELFSAVVPISGWFNPDKAMLLKDVPIWAFHCVADDIVPVSGTEDMVKALTSIGGNVRVTYYSGLKHNHKVMYETYNKAELYTWLLNHKRKV
ncbi:prolyl oligopeptidase family serine peptidase [Paenibacillus sp. HWE-109]|uniref:carboxylesterase family protein n=1 Tax=Paenibacillus sp. HWE-109 TaxID=1306526 RepID=UPI001EE096C5|nr:prolyl oligopeptidase family serine peptidase [Paenibacillus sp. HWE-109]UKS27352.1 prolyl oligopeptidase family serine peptidase [Paenibacillus sp. HWE-109]